MGQLDHFLTHCVFFVDRVENFDDADCIVFDSLTSATKITFKREGLSVEGQLIVFQV